MFLLDRERFPAHVLIPFGEYIMMEFPCADIGNGVGQISILSGRPVFTQRYRERKADFESRSKSGKNSDYEYMFLLKIDTQRMAQSARAICSRDLYCDDFGVMKAKESLGCTSRGFELFLFSIVRVREIPVERWEAVLKRAANEFEWRYESAIRAA